MTRRPAGVRRRAVPALVAALAVASLVSGCGTQTSDAAAQQVARPEPVATPAGSVATPSTSTPVSPGPSDTASDPAATAPSSTSPADPSPSALLTATLAPPVTVSVRIAQANLYKRLSRAEFESDLARVVAGDPDFVTVNEAYRRGQGALTPEGYDAYRDGSITDARDTPVLWRTDRWFRVDGGTALMHDRRSVKWGVRYANWVTLLSRDHPQLVVSVISVHASPGGGGRQGLLRTYLRRLDDLAAQLRTRGPVLIGGDLNARYSRARANLPTWLSRSGAVSTYRALGRPQGGWGTGPGGGAIDYLFSIGGAPVRHRTVALSHSDHRMLTATIEVTSGPH